MNPFLLYLVLIADNIRSTAGLVITINAVGIPVCFIFFAAFASEYEIERDTIKNILSGCFAKILITLGVLINIACILVLTFLPDTKKLAAGVIIYSVTSNEELQKIPNNVLEILNLKLDEIEDQLIEEVEEEE